jgi:hypothetical protein
MNTLGNTIVTACDRNYLWGAYILVASLRIGGSKDPIHVLADGFTDEDKVLLEQFKDVEVFDVVEKTHHCMALQKPDAILTADTELISWIDSDCMIIGNVDHLFRSDCNRFQIRTRDEAEVAEQYSRLYFDSDIIGEVPRRILDCWKGDIGERQEPLLKQSVVDNCFVLNRGHIPFIKKWKRQMINVLSESSGLVDRQNEAYFMSDESVITSLLAFADDAPCISEYQFDRDPNSYLVHFSLSPKPWQAWTRNSFRFYNQLMELLFKASEQGYKMPAKPFSLREGNKLLCYMDSHCRRYHDYILKLFNSS